MKDNKYSESPKGSILFVLMTTIAGSLMYIALSINRMVLHDCPKPREQPEHLRGGSWWWMRL